MVYSIRDAKSKLVIGHASEINLIDVEFKVNQKGRLKVLRDKRKNVHAVIEGYIQPNLTLTSVGRLITYNPYLYDSFVLKNDSRVRVSSAKSVFIRKEKIKAIGLLFI